MLFAYKERDKLSYALASKCTGKNLTLLNLLTNVPNIKQVVTSLQIATSNLNASSAQSSMTPKTPDTPTCVNSERKHLANHGKCPADLLVETRKNRATTI